MSRGHSSTPLPAEVWAAKAHALLWLLPLGGEAGNPQGEAIWRLVDQLGFRAPPSLQPLLTRARQWAYDANLGVPIPSGGAAPARPLLKHPLSAQELTSEPLPTLAEIEAALDTVANGADDARRYRRLWFRLSERGWYLRHPASYAMPDHSLRGAGSLAAAYAGIEQRGERPALLYLHVGPVQSFIEAARRTHDLWIGSFTVAQLALGAAIAVAEAEGPDAVIYPDLGGQTLARWRLLDEKPEAEARSRLVRAAVPNRILALVPEGRAEALAAAAVKAIDSAWREMGAAVREGLGSAHSESNDWSAFDEQLAEHLEVDAVSLPWPREWEDAWELLDRFHRLPSELPAQVINGAVGYGSLFHLPGEVQEPQQPNFVSTGAAFGALFHLTHGALSAHRSAGRWPAVPATTNDHRPKCSQCGQRSQMGPIADDPRRQQEESREFWEGLSEGFQQGEGGGERQSERASIQLTIGDGLCAVCLTKRFSPQLYWGGKESPIGLSWRVGDPDRPLLRFPSVESVASAPFRLWINRALGPDSELIAAWQRALAEVHRRGALDYDPPGNLLSALGPIGRLGGFLDFDGSWSYESAYDPEVAWRDHFSRPPIGGDQERRKRIEVALQAAERAHRELVLKVDATPSPYYAVVKLDGDAMGKWLTGRHPRAPKINEIAGRGIPGRRPLFPALHGDLSRRLAQLAEDQGPAIVERYLGRVIYSGGDDLLAVLPLQTVLPCLNVLREMIRGQEHLGDRVTVSAGVAITHGRSPLQRAIAEARRGEKLAKQAGANRVAVVLIPRSGAPQEVILSWPGTDPAVGDEIAGLLELVASARRSGQKEREDEQAPPGPLDGDSPFLSPNYAHQVAVDAAVLGGSGIEGAFQALLLRKLLKPTNGERKDHTTKREPSLPPLLGNSDPARARDILFLVRFLLREEGNIPTEELLELLAARGGSP